MIRKVSTVPPLPTDDMSQIFYLILMRIETGQLQGQQTKYLNLLRTPNQPKVCEIARHKLRGMIWDDCDKSSGHEDKASRRDQEEGGSRGCVGNCYFATAKNEARTEQGCFVSFRPALSKTWRPTGTIRRSIRCPTAGQPTPTSDSGNLTCWIGIAPLAGA